MRSLFTAFAFALLAAPAISQMPPLPGQHDATRVTAGSYHVDPDHTIVEWSVNHLGFSNYFGLFGAASGSLDIDPAHMNAAKVVVTIPISSVMTTSEKLTGELKSPMFLNATEHVNARFTSTSVVINGDEADITGDLMLHGVVKPITLHAHFVGAGVNAMIPGHKFDTIGFDATGSFKRTDFGIKTYAPFVSDEVQLKITAAFVK